MIARLTGTLAETSADGAVIDVGGVGYQVLASARTLDALGPVGGDVLLLTELQVREDGWTLFGFVSARFYRMEVAAGVANPGKSMQA